MSAVVPLLAALALVPSAAHAPSLSISTRLFAPPAGPMTITARVDTPARLGLRLARASGRTVGWIDPPAARSQVLVNWDGSVGGRPVRDGAYQVVLVVNGRAAGRAGFRLDGTPASLADLRVASNSTPFAGDNALLATITPNHDDVRDYARVRFDLSERAQVTLEVQRTTQAAQTISTHTWQFDAGRHSVGWVPASTIAARTYLLSLTTTDAAGNTLTYGSPDARRRPAPAGAVVRVMGIDATMARQSYHRGRRAACGSPRMHPAVSTQVLKAGPEPLITYADNLLEGVAVTSPSVVDWTKFRNAPRVLPIEIGADWESGLYFVRLFAADGTVGYAPFIVRPATLGAASRVAVILPTNTWQAYNFWDSDGNGWGDSWYIGFPNRSVSRVRPYLRRGVPPFYYRYDQPFLHWLYWTGKKVDFLAERDLDELSGDDLAKAYDLVVYPGHSEYVTTHEYDMIERYRNLGGNLIFLSANNFFWHVAEHGQTITRDDAVARPRPAGGVADRRAVPRERPRRAPGPVPGARPEPGRPGSGRAPVSSRARPWARRWAATESRSTTRRRRHRPARSCSRRSPTSTVRASRRRCRTTRRRRARRCSPPGRSTSAAPR